MTFWEHFRLVLPRKPIQALAALYWHLTRRKVRARNRLRVATASLPHTYALWIATAERDAELACDVDAFQRWNWRPRFLVLFDRSSGETPWQLDRSVRSIEQQTYPLWTLAEGSLGDAWGTDADYIIFLRVGDLLSKNALIRIADAIQKNRDASIVYGDQDELDSRGRRSAPWFKPRWNEEMFLAQNYLTGAVAIKSELAKTADKDAENLSELLLAATFRADGAIIHIPHILTHVLPRPHEQEEWLAAVARHLQAFDATCVPGPFHTVKVEWPLPEALPLVSIIVPTKDKLELLQPCIESVLCRTDYSKFEILIVDNASTEKRTSDYLTEIGKNPKVRVLRYPQPYNYSAINNFAVGHAGGSYVCLLNNDTEVLRDTWLTDMMRYALRPMIGAVGAKLLYDDGSIQHAGVVIGIGEAAGHAHRFLPAGEPGYFRQPHLTQFVSAVTAACLVVEKAKFLAVGGLDEANLAVAFNDVDLCLKLEVAGWRNIYVPHAELLHHESKSRGSDTSPHNIERYRRELNTLQERWRTKTYDDPLHNPNLDRYSETFVLRL